MFGLALSATEKGAKGPQKGQKGPQPSAWARWRGIECPELLVVYIKLFIGKVIYLQVITVHHIDRGYIELNYSTVN